MKKLFYIKLGLFLSFFCASIYAAPILPDESKVQVTLYVSPGGNDSNAGTQNSPFQTIGKAWNIAMDNLKAARGVKISIADGTYDQGGGQLKIGDIAQRSAAQNVDFNNAYDINVAGISDSNLKNTVFVVEGQNAGKAIITGSADQVIWINGKYNFVMRNITMKGCAKTTIQAGSWEPISDTRYWLLDNCSFIENAKGHSDFIASIQTVRDITIRNCKFNDNYGNGVYLVLIDAQVDNCEFNNNLRSLGEPAFGVLNGYAGGLNFSGLNVVFNNCKINDNGGIGFHNDLTGKNITFTGCEFNNNGHSAYRDGLDPGFKWEIAEGPVYINNCKINGNATGVQLETAQNFYFDKSQIQDNTITQIKITWKNRTVIDNNNSDKWGNGGTGDLSLAPGKIFQYRKVLNGTLNSNFTNNCISTTKGSSSYIYLRRDDTSWDLYTNWFTKELHANNNTYYSSSNTNVFNTNQVFTDLAGWKSATGQDGSSTWQNTCSGGTCTPPSVPGSLTASAGSTSQINLSWVNNDNNATGFIIERKQGTGSYSTIATLGAGVKSYSNTGLSAATAYTFRVTATSAGCNSAASNEATATTNGSTGAVSYAINSGGGATGTYAVDAYVSGGNTSTTTSTIDVSGVTNPAPAAVYQSERWGSFTYTFPSLITGKSYTVRLHFAEIYWDAASKRKFNIDINGTRQITEFDIFTVAGAKNKAIVKEFTITPNSSNQIIISFINGSLDNAKVSAIEVTTDSSIGGSSYPLSRSGWIASGFGYSGSDTPDKAIDGNTSTKWSSGTFLNPSQWFIVNMGSAQTFNKIDFDAGAGNVNDYARGYNIYVSNDGSNWGSPVASGTGSNRDITVSFPAQTAQYIKIEQTGQSGLFWWAINEFNVYNTGTGSRLSSEETGNKKSSLSLNREDHINVSIFPNPAVEGVNVEFYSSKSGLGSIDLKSIDGRTEKLLKISVQEGYNKVYIHVNELQDGIHILYLNTLNNVKVYKLIIAK